MGRRAAGLALTSLGVVSVAAARRRNDAAEAAEEAVVKGPLDRRVYETRTLANGLRVLLASDPEADRAAAALDVHVGFFSDPDDLPGVAHFCEHMLFLGTEQYPEENSFDKFLADSTGSSNAFTDNEDTCFFFSCAPGALEGALERFGTFFQKPLFTQSATEREVNAINSEHEKNLQDDGFRLRQLQGDRANPAHPFHHFGTGNRATLVDATRERGADLRGALLNHYDAYYRGPLMTLCILGREELSSLGAFAERFFGGIRGGGDVPVRPATKWLGTAPFLPAAFGSTVDVVPVSNSRFVQVAFPIVFYNPAADSRAAPSPPFALSLEMWRRYTPATHVGAVIGYEGPKSLCALLRRRDLATALEANVAEENESFAMMSIFIELTAAGFKQRDTVLELLFGYLKMLRDLSKWPKELADENVQLSEAYWRTTEALPAGDAVVRLAGNMQVYTSPRDYIAGGVRLQGGPDLEAAIISTISALAPKNALVTTSSRDFESVAKAVEPWYGTKYREEPVNKTRWESARPIPGLALPPPNPFLPRSLELKAPRAPRLEFGQVSPPPQLQRSDDRWSVYFRQDTEFGVPKAYACFQFLTNYPRSSAKTSVLSRLYEALLLDGLAETLLYDARVAGLVFELATSPRGVQIFFAGFDDRLVDFGRAAISAMLSFSPSKDPSKFEGQKDLLARELESYAARQPYQQASYWAALATTLPDFSVEELQGALAKVTAADVAAFATRLWTQELLYGFAHFQGNILKEEAEALVKVVDTSLNFKPLAKELWPVTGSVQVPLRAEGSGCVLVRDALDPKEENSAVQVVFQAGISRRLDGDNGRRRWAAMQTLSAALRDRFYTELRTKQQLGYIVNATGDRREGLLRLVLTVQSTALDPIGILGRIDEFLFSVREDLARTPERELNDLANGLAQLRLNRPQSLAESVNTTWLEVTTRELLWDRPLAEAAALRSVTRDEVLEFFDRCVAPGGSERRRLVTLIYGAAHRAQRRDAEAILDKKGAVTVKDPQIFKSDLPSWPTLGFP